MELCFEYKFTPRFSDIDSYGIAHHSKFFCWFDEARFYLINSLLGLDKVESTELRSPIIELGAEYKRPILFMENYIINIKFLYNYNKPFFRFEYQVKDLVKKTVLCVAFTEHVLVSDKGKLLLCMPEFIVEKLKAIEKEGESAWKIYTSMGLD